MARLKIIEESKDPYDTYFYYMPYFLTFNQQDKLLNWLDDMNDFVPSISYNNSRNRSQKWYHQNETYFCEPWCGRHEKWVSFKYDSTLLKLQAHISNILNDLERRHNIPFPELNSCLVNKYKNGQEYIHGHSDSEDAFGKYPTISGISLGSPRKLVFRRIYGRDERKLDRTHAENTLEYTLEPGSLFVMAGCSQEYFTHEIPTSDSKNKRYSLTFREHIL